MRGAFMYIFVILFSINLLSQKTQHYDEQPIFINGEEGYICYRIPAIIKAENGDLLAFAEGRVDGCSDFGDVDIVLKVSIDNGTSWSPLRVVADNGLYQSGNPAPVLDRFDSEYPNGRIFLFYNNGIASEHDTRKGKGLRTVLYITSEDHGLTWSDPTDITMQVHKPYRPDIDKKYNNKADWRSYANTPGHALQLQKGKHAGRIFVPANHSEGPPQKGFNDYRAHAFYSDDHGDSWQLSESVDIPSSNESIAVELSDGRLMQNIRQQNGSKRERLVAISDDGGTSWDEIYFDSTLISPVCQASLISYLLPSGREVLLFSNPESKTSREKMTIKMSFDNGQSWPVKRQIRRGESAYSDLVVQQNSHIGILYEHGNDGGIYYARVNMNWLVGDTNNEEHNWVSKYVDTDFAKGSDFRLSTPIPVYESSMFSDSVKVNFKLDYPDRVIHYTLDGSTPYRNSRKYDNQLIIRESGMLKAKAFHPEVRPSEMRIVNFLKAKSSEVNRVEVTPEPNRKYKGNGAASLFDMKKGSTSYGDGLWLGFNESSIDIDVSLEESTSVNVVKLSLLSAHDAWIFLPREIIITAGDFTKNVEISAPTKQEPSSSEFIQIDLGSKEVKDFKITIKGLEAIPEWHQGKGSVPWIFIDEIIIE